MGRLRSREKFKRIAKELIMEYGTNDPFELCKLLNIKIIYENNFEFFFGMYCEVNKEKRIIINSSHDELTRRIICSHELGHSFQDHESVLFMKENYLFGTEQVENEANYFAAALVFGNLIPDNLVNDENRKLLNDLIRYL
ncbi:ImmA/IrrE family metallo-endopeptidase [Leptotrichia wadei]|uniref:ImmA/IrrE family metallo-endopeptidase n=1 Tax=Leptotrichia wadei TaxID=157687 RepID=UPI0028D602FF|nr:ImmA/IrrE family metallo-endopeptidase [Leptotrichia wadei]